MGDQEKVGLAMMSAFFRRYVGGDVAFDPYMTGEISADGVTPQLPASACPTSASGTRIPCFDRVHDELLRRARPSAATSCGPRPTTRSTVSALGTVDHRLAASRTRTSRAAASRRSRRRRPGGFDWCNPEPTHFAPSQLGVTGLPTATKGCPLPAAAALGGQSGTRENAPVNHSYGLQLALAWDQPASIGTRIPAASGDVTGFKSLALGAAVNFFDPRNPSRGTDAIWNPGLTTQNFTIALTDKAGKVGIGRRRVARATARRCTRRPAPPRPASTWCSTRSASRSSDFAAQGVDLANLRKLELRFGGAGMPATGSIQLSDVRFQEAAAGPTVYTDKLADVAPTTPPAADAGAGGRPVRGRDRRSRRRASRAGDDARRCSRDGRDRVTARQQAPAHHHRNELAVRQRGQGDDRPGERGAHEQGRSGQGEGRQVDRRARR